MTSTVNLDVDHFCKFSALFSVDKLTDKAKKNK